MIIGLSPLELSLMKLGSSMKNNRHVEIDQSKHRMGFSMWGMVFAIVLGTVGFTTVHAQSTAGRIFGSAPAGETITVHGTSGVHRHAKANAKGRYTITSLPMGVYTVALEKDGNAVDTRSNIPLTVGRGSEVDFACGHDQCAESASN